MQIPRRKSDELRRRDPGPLYITQEGLDRLREKLAHHKRILPDLIAETQRTAAYGDRSDSAEYKEAKGALRRSNWQILSIADQIKRAEIITPGPNASGTVQLGSTVTLHSDKANEKEKILQIVGPHETNPTNGRISHKSPLGAALLDHKKGDVVTIKTENGSHEYKIIEIK